MNKKNVLSHLSPEGKVRMVDVGGKPVVARFARAQGLVKMGAETLKLVASGSGPKGEVFNAARLAAIAAAKKTAELIPLCHFLPLSVVEVDLRLDFELSAVEIETRVRAESRTGVEMEALTAVAAAALTVYDMLNAVDKGMEIASIRLFEKKKGRPRRQKGLR